VRLEDEWGDEMAMAIGDAVVAKLLYYGRYMQVSRPKWFISNINNTCQ